MSETWAIVLRTSSGTMQWVSTDVVRVLRESKTAWTATPMDCLHFAETRIGETPETALLAVSLHMEFADPSLTLHMLATPTEREAWLDGVRETLRTDAVANNGEPPSRWLSEYVPAYEVDQLRAMWTGDNPAGAINREAQDAIRRLADTVDALRAHGKIVREGGTRRDPKCERESRPRRCRTRRAAARTRRHHTRTRSLAPIRLRDADGPQRGAVVGR